MKIFYRISNDWNKEQAKLLQSFGITVELGFDMFDIEEGHTFFQLKPTLEKWKAHISYGTEFKRKDLASASLIFYSGVWERGYPQPEENFGFMNLTYDLKGYCEVCGIGAIQNSPFRIKQEPKWGEKKMFELNWIWDEIFVRKDFYETVFKKYGLSYIPVMKKGTNEILQNTVQLDIPIVKTPLLLEDYPFEICNTCNRKRYDVRIKGFFPNFSKEIKEYEVFKCFEYFGTGAYSGHRIFITKKIYDELSYLKLKVYGTPCAPPSYTS